MPAQWLQVSLYEKAIKDTDKRRLIRPYDFHISEAKMETYKTIGKQSYSGLSLEAKVEVDWIDDRYRVPLKSPVYGNIPIEYANVKMFKPKYF